MDLVWRTSFQWVLRFPQNPVISSLISPVENNPLKLWKQFCCITKSNLELEKDSKLQIARSFCPNRVCINQTTISLQRPDFPRSAMGSTPELYNLSWDNFRTSLSSTVQSLRGLGDLVDVTLTAGGKMFPAHKLVLCSASPLLMELLKSTKCEHPVVMLAGISPADLEALLHFVYTGEVSVDPAQIPSLLQAAQCLDIQPFSPNLLSVHLTQKTVEAIPSPVLGETNRPLHSAYLSVRKKRKKLRPYSEEAEGDDSSKDSSLLKKSTLLSDLPVSCSICGVTLRQSRNLRRHMALIHMKYTHPPGVNKNNPSPKKMLKNLHCPMEIKTEYILKDDTESCK